MPFRNSKLTHVLKDSLGGSCKTIMIATIRPGAAFYGQTLSTLRYASRARDIKNMPVRHSDETGGEAKLADAYKQIEVLRQQLMGRGREFDRLKNDPQSGSPESQRRLRGLQLKHASEVKEVRTCEERSDKLRRLETAGLRNEATILPCNSSFATRFAHRCC